MLEISVSVNSMIVREVDVDGNVLNEKLLNFNELKSGINVFGDYYFDGGFYKQVDDKKYSVRIKLIEKMF